jgi:hypothetical protein
VAGQVFLFQKIIGPAFDQLARDLRPRGSTDSDHRDMSIVASQFLQEMKTVPFFELIIDDDEFGSLRVEEFDSLTFAVGINDLELKLVDRKRSSPT